MQKWWRVLSIFILGLLPSHSWAVGICLKLVEDQLKNFPDSLITREVQHIQQLERSIQKIQEFEEKIKKLPQSLFVMPPDFFGGVVNASVVSIAKEKQQKIAIDALRKLEIDLNNYAAFVEDSVENLENSFKDFLKTKGHSKEERLQSMNIVQRDLLIYKSAAALFEESFLYSHLPLKQYSSMYCPTEVSFSDMKSDFLQITNYIDQRSRMSPLSMEEYFFYFDRTSLEILENLSDQIQTLRLVDHGQNVRFREAELSSVVQYFVSLKTKNP